MSINISRKTVLACALTPFLAAPLFTAATAEAATVISIGATASSPNQRVTAIQGYPYYTPIFEDDPVTDVKIVKYPASIGIFPFESMGSSVDKGTEASLVVVKTTSGKKIYFCESQGCISGTQMLSELAKDPETAPAAGDLVFIRVGDPTNPDGGYSTRNAGNTDPLFRIKFPGAAPDSPYKTMFVTKEYDFFADTPDPSAPAHAYMLAQLNLWAGFAVVHPNYGNVDVSDPNNLIKVEGNQTFILVPTKRLPLLDGLYNAALAWKKLTGQTGFLKEVERMDREMRAIIDQAYDRTGYVPLGSYVPPEAVNEVPASAQASLRGTLPEEAYKPPTVSLDAASNESEAKTASNVPSKEGGEVVTDIAPLPEKVETSVEPVTPVITPEVSNEQKPVVETPVEQKPVESPTVQSSPQGATGEGSQASVDTKQPEAEKPKVAENETAPKTTLKKSGDGVKKTTVRNHRTPKVNSTTASNDDTSSNASASNSSSGSNSGASSDSGSTND